MKELALYLAINPKIRFGKPCIAGTRVAISDILQWLASGMSTYKILNDYPSLKETRIKAALAFAADGKLFIKIIAA